MVPNLTEQYDGIVRCCDDLSAALATRPPASMTELTRHRLRLSRLVQENLSDEEREVGGPLRLLPVESRPEGFAALSGEVDSLRQSYSRHVQRWNMPAVEADRDGYRAAVAGLVAELKDHLSRKRQMLPRWQRLADRLRDGAPRQD